MKTTKTFVFLLFLLVVHCAQGADTNLIVTPSEVDPKSVKLLLIEQPNLIFHYSSKTPAEVRDIAKRHSPVNVVNDGVVIAKAPSCTGYKAWIGEGGDKHLDFVGLVVVFHDPEQAKLAFKALKGEQ